MNKNRTRRLTILAVLAALTFVLGWFTKIPIPGGYFTLLDAGIFTTALLLGKREGLIVGALAGFLNDFLGGYANYMFFTLVIHGAQGYTGALTKRKLVNYIISAFLMVGGYAVADWVNYHSLGVVFPDLLVNFVQTTVGYLIALLLVPLLKKAGITNGLKTTQE